MSEDSRSRGPHVDSRAHAAPIDSRIRVQGHTVEDVKKIIREVLLEGNYRGEPGAASTVPGPKVQISIGRVVAGEAASASLRDDGDNQVLDLVLPRGLKGDPGLDSQVVGPAGTPGGVGAKGDRGRDGKDAPSLEEIRNTTIGVLRCEEMRQNYRGEKGESITGPAGKDASLDDIRKVVVELLSSEEIRGQYRGERGRDGADGAEGPAGRNPDKGEIQEWVLQILKRNRLIG